MSDLDQELARRLQEFRAQGLARSLRLIESAQGAQIQIDGRDFLNFSSNDYLGLAQDERLKRAAIAAIEKFGTGSGASRLICGSLAPHHQLEAALADFKHTEAALAFSSGYAAALGAISALLGKDDVIILDKLVHASIVDAARLCGAKLRVFAHNDLDDLERILRWVDAVKAGGKKSKALIVTESVFSMDGDCAPLRQIIQLKEQFGAWLMLDEAHGTGLYGVRGAGLADHLGVADHIEIQMGTLGKALGASGGFVCGSRRLIDYLINRARSFVFSTAPVPAASSAAAEAIHLVQTPEGETRRCRLWQRVRELRSLLKLVAPQISTAILPQIIGDEAKTMAAASALYQRGIFVPGIRYPSVPRGQARLRITVSASHTSEQIQLLASALSSLAEPGVSREKPLATAGETSRLSKKTALHPQ